MVSRLRNWWARCSSLASAFAWRILTNQRLEKFLYSLIHNPERPPTEDSLRKKKTFHELLKKKGYIDPSDREALARHQCDLENAYNAWIASKFNRLESGFVGSKDDPEKKETRYLLKLNVYRVVALFVLVMFTELYERIFATMGFPVPYFFSALIPCLYFYWELHRHLNRSVYLSRSSIFNTRSARFLLVISIVIIGALIFIWHEFFHLP